MLELSLPHPQPLRADCAYRDHQKGLRSAALKELPEKTARMKKLGLSCAACPTG